jgi:putative endonuclease
MWYTYILLSLKDNKYYIGSTCNLKNRLLKHNSGGNTSTKNRRPLELVFFESFITKTESQERERQIKSYKGGIAFKKLLQNNIWAGTQAVNEGRL